MGATGASRRTLVSVGLVLLGAGIWPLIGQAAGFSEIFERLHDANPWWLAVCLAGQALAYAGYARLYRSVAAADGGPRHGPVLGLRVTLAAFGASMVATAAGRLGTEYWSLRRAGEAVPRAWARVLALNTVEWAFLAAAAWTGALLLLLGVGPGAPLVVELSWLLALPLCLAPALYVTTGWRRSLAADRGGRGRRTLAAAVRALLLLRGVAARPRELGAALAGGTMYWGGELLMLWAALQAFGVHLGPAALVVAFATGYAATVVPLPAGGVGGIAAAATFALTLVGVPLGPALLATGAQRLFGCACTIVPAGLAARSLARLGDDLAASAGQPVAEDAGAAAGSSPLADVSLRISPSHTATAPASVS